MEDAHEIISGVFLGNMKIASNYLLLKHMKITHVVNCAMEIPNYHVDKDITYKHFVMNDTPSQNILQHFNEAFTFIDNALKNGGKVLVHCAMGISRSSTILASYIMKKYGLPHDKVLRQMKKIRVIVNPNLGFLKQLQ